MQQDIRQFDLNIERVLEHWTIAHALRELIANALDEQCLTNTASPRIMQDESGSWHIQDSGRGLRYEHLTQNENTEKLRHPHIVIGKFGVGLKDAFATLDRHRIGITIYSPHNDITITKTEKAGFTDILTLHALIHLPSHPHQVGTDIVLTGVQAQDIATAKDFFLTYSRDEILEQTPYGAVLRPHRKLARVYINGLCVAEEENFLFSYNITSLTGPLRKALNRERTNVGRSAYTDRIKMILLACQQAQVAELLAHDLKHFETGRLHDELQWTDVSLHACKILNASEKVIFLTADQLRQGSSLITHAQHDGYRVTVVPQTIAVRLPHQQDQQGHPLRDLHQYQQEWDRSFQFQYVSPEQLSADERRTFALTQPLLHLLDQHLPHKIKEIRISETMRINASGEQVLGVWEPEEQRIVILRTQLQEPANYAATLIHEAIHAFTGADDGTSGFEAGLTHALGTIAIHALNPTSHI